MGSRNYFCFLATEQVTVGAMNSPNNRIHADSEKRRSFLALVFAAGDAWRYAPSLSGHLLR